MSTEEKMAEALREMLLVQAASQGIAGYHLNGDTAEWDEFDFVDQSREALAEYDRTQDVPEDVEPIGWVFQNSETGQMVFCENDGVNNAENFAENNPRHVLCGPAYTTFRAADAHRQRVDVELIRDVATNLRNWGAAVAKDPVVAAANMILRAIGDSSHE